MVIQALVDLSNLIRYSQLLVIKKNFLCNGRYSDERTSDVVVNGNVNKTKTAANKAKTPKSLFGMERKIA
jgi:hypothetical protein